LLREGSSIWGRIGRGDREKEKRERRDKIKIVRNYSNKRRQYQRIEHDERSGLGETCKGRENRTAKN
jgi:hypothetical protein